LKTVYKIQNRNGVRNVPENGFPILIEGAPIYDIRIVGLEEHEEAAYS
jgi:hypothetical protein